MVNIFILFISLFSIQAIASEDVLKILKKSLLSINQMKLYSDWHKSPNHPDTVIEGLLKNKIFSENKICEALSLLDNNEKYNYFGTVTSSSLSLNLICSTKYIAEVEQTIKKRHQTFNSSVLSILNSLTPSIHTYIDVDTDYGQTFIDGDLPDKTVALTFDDGPHPVLTKKILKVLSDFKIKANFFTIGKRITQFPHILALASDDGHTIGNHSWTHSSMSKMHYKDSVKEIINTFNKLNSLPINSVPFFRYPYGASSKKVSNYLKQNGVSNFFWNIDTLDWKYKDPDSLLNYALNEVEKTRSGIILFHDIQPQTLMILPDFLYALKSRGYRFVSYKTKND